MSFFLNKFQFRRMLVLNINGERCSFYFSIFKTFSHFNNSKYSSNRERCSFRIADDFCNFCHFCEFAKLEELKIFNCVFLSSKI